MYAWGEGIGIALFAVALHQLAHIPESVMHGLFLLAGQRLPRGRFADGKRYELMRKTRTAEQRAAREKDDE